MMRVAFCLPALSDYRDRLEMVCALSDRTQHLYLLTDHLDEDTERHLLQWPKLTAVPLGRKTFKDGAFKWLHAKTHLGELDVIHDTFGHLSAFFQATSSIEGRPFRLVSTLYTNNWGWFQRVRRPTMDFGWSYVAQRVVTLWRDRRVCRTADRIIVLGPGLEDDLVDGHGMDPARVEWLPSEINTELFSPNPSAVEEGRLLFTGAICRNKGMDVLLESISLVQHPSVTLRLVGRVLPWEKAWFEDAVRAHGCGHRLECPGPLPRESLVQEYQRAQLYVFPSRFEGSPRSVREALASGLPCILSDLPGHRAVDPDESFTWRVDGFNPRAWAQVIDRALGESHSRWLERSRSGVAHMQAAHRPDAVADRVLDVYERVLRTPAVSA